MLASSKNHFAIVDIESSWKDDIIEIGIIIYDGIRVVETFHSLINPQRKISETVKSLTGIQDYELTQAPLFVDIADHLFQLLQNKIFVAHDYEHDLHLLQAYFDQLGINFAPPQCICTQALAKNYFNKHDINLSLDQLSQYFGIKILNRHRAIDDAQATLKIFNKLKDYWLSTQREIKTNTLLPDWIGRKYCLETVLIISIHDKVIALFCDQQINQLLTHFWKTLSFNDRGHVSVCEKVFPHYLEAKSYYNKMVGHLKPAWNTTFIKNELFYAITLKQNKLNLIEVTRNNLSQLNYLALYKSQIIANQSIALADSRNQKIIFYEENSKKIRTKSNIDPVDFFEMPRAFMIKNLKQTCSVIIHRGKVQKRQYFLYKEDIYLFYSQILNKQISSYGIIEINQPRGLKSHENRA